MEVDNMNTTSYPVGFDTSVEPALYIPPLREEVVRIITIAISSFGIPANFCVVIIIGMTPTMRAKRFNMYVMHQSVIDLCACCITLLSQIYYDVTAVPKRYHTMYCQLWVSDVWTWFFVLCSNYNLVLMSAERCIAITGNYVVYLYVY